METHPSELLGWGAGTLSSWWSSWWAEQWWERHQLQKESKTHSSAR
jgi:hypothetical protein